MQSTRPFIVVALSALLFAGCHGPHVRSKPSSPPASAPPPTKQAHRGGPPAHAPAHGYRRKFAYTYYPGANVYYAPDRGVYFWIEGPNWKVGAHLPRHVRISALDEGVAVELDRENPYEPAAHVSAHPSGKDKWADH